MNNPKQNLIIATVCFVLLFAMGAYTYKDSISKSIGKLSKSNNWFLFKSSLKIAKIFRMKNLFLNNPKNFKFPPFERKKVLLKIDELIKILKIKEELNCEFLSDRTLLIKKK